MSPNTKPSYDHSWHRAPVLYGSILGLVPDTAVLDADGKPTSLKLKRLWTAKPGDVLDSRQVDRDGTRRRYMVHGDRSIRKI